MFSFPRRLELTSERKVDAYRFISNIFHTAPRNLCPFWPPNVTHRSHVSVCGAEVNCIVKLQRIVPIARPKALLLSERRLPTSPPAAPFTKSCISWRDSFPGPPCSHRLQQSHVSSTRYLKLYRQTILVVTVSDRFTSLPT